MGNTDILKNKKILVVDDEPDILETIEELLYESSIDSATSFEAAEKFLKHNTYDLAILDIMGVRGYDILELTRERNIPTLMLTAHALSPDNLKKSIEKGADSYVPKDKLSDISSFVADVLKARKEGKSNHAKWFSRLKPFFDKTFGKGWRDEDRDFWNQFDEKYFIASKDDVEKML